VHLSKKDKRDLIEIFKAVDVKKLEIDHPEERIVKWTRFGAFQGLAIACEIIKALPEKPSAKTKVDVS
jgi:hypothetical protein